MAFSLKDSILKVQAAIVTETGPIPIGAPIRLYSHTKVSVSPGGKTSYLKGAAMLPIDILIGTAEPKVEIECSDGPEVWAALQSIGGIGTAMIATLVFQRGLIIPAQFTFQGTWGNGGGVELDETNGAKPDKIEMPCTDILFDLGSIYNQSA